MHFQLANPRHLAGGCQLRIEDDEMSDNPPPDVFAIELRLITDASGNVRLDHQTQDSSLLRTLAACGFQDVALNALNIVFRYGYKSDDLYDALAAYAYCPMEKPPAQYREMFQRVDWKMDNPPNALFAIVLAGSRDEADKRLLLDILNTLSSDYREAAIFAAASHAETRFLKTITSIALATDENEMFATGEMHAFIFCFRRWLDTEFINLQLLEELFVSVASSQPCRMPWKRFMNYLICRNWLEIPFPNARDC